MDDLVLYFFRVRDAGKRRQTRYRLSDDEARLRYGDGNFERLDWTREVRIGEPGAQSTAHLLGKFP